MKIGFDAMLLSGPFSGVHTYIHNLSRALAGLAPEHDYTMFIPRGFPSKEYRDFSNVRTSKAVISGKTRSLRIFWEHFWFPFKVFKYGFDLIHFPGYIHPYIRGVPTVVTVHDLNAIIAPELCKRANVQYYNRFLKRSVEFATRVIVPTERVMNDIYTLLKKPKTCIDVIPMGSDMGNLPEPGNDIREKYGIGGKPFVLFLGNIDPKKGITYLIKAFFAAYMYKRLDYNLVIAGNRTWQFRKMRKLVSEFGEEFADRVIFTGYIERNDLPGLYTEADLLVAPSILEGFGIPPLEAMSCRTPVLCSTEPALKENYSGYAHFFNIADLKDLRSKLENLLTDRGELGKYTQKAGEFADKLTWKACAEKTLQTYLRAAEEFKES